MAERSPGRNRAGDGATPGRRRWTVGLDVRPALFGVTGVGRAAREVALALGAHERVRLRGYGAAWSRARPALALPDVAAPRLPGRVQQLLAPLGFGVEHVLGGVDVFTHTDVVYAPVRRTPEVALLHDVLFLSEAPWHGADFRATVGRRVRRRLPRMAAVVVPCAAVADDLMRHGLVPSGPVVVAPLGCDHVDPRAAPDDEARVAALLERAGLTRRADEQLVVALGTREPRKNHGRLLDAWERLPADLPARLLLVGPPGWGCADLERRLATHAARPPEERRVATAGEVSAADLAALLRRMDVLAYPSLAEGFGLPVAEALACGRPVLTAAGTPMAAFGGAAVLAVDALDVTALAAGLRRLIDDAGLRGELSAAGPEAVAGLTWASHAEQLLSVYDDVLS